MVMGIELFGPDVVLPLVVGCGMARLASGRRNIYEPLERDLAAG
jgi:hypothetical protein